MPPLGSAGLARQALRTRLNARSTGRVQSVFAEKLDAEDLKERIVLSVIVRLPTLGSLSVQSSSL